MRAKPLLATGLGKGLSGRQWGGIGQNSVRMGDDETSRIPAEGRITKWQYYTRTPGKVGFQVWRRNGTIDDKR